MNKFVNADPDVFESLAALSADAPVTMLNLIKLNGTAVYKDGTSCSGREAYASYTHQIGSIFSRVGGKIIWSGSGEMTVVGPENESWDLVFMAQYPSVQSFLDMIQDPEYLASLKHRTAAVDTSRLICARANEDGGVYG